MQDFVREENNSRRTPVVVVAGITANLAFENLCKRHIFSR
jgi:hypothetical protein